MATLKDVARESGLTVGTVSRVLNNRGYISEQTRAKVYEVMRQLNYQPNEMARSLSKQRSNILGVIVPHIVHPYFAKFLDCVEAAASKEGYRILLFNSQGMDEREDECIEICKSNRVAGVILCSGTFHTEKLKNLNCPLITMERFIDEGAAGVECDNYMGGTLATEHLIAKGCRHLLHFSGVIGTSMPADDRQRAFEDVCRKNNIDWGVMACDRGYFDQMDYYTMIRDAFEKYPQTDGVFASSDVIAAQTIQVCRERGIDVPGQIKIVGFDDVSIASLTCPTVTTIRQPVEEMAETAVTLMSRLLKDEMVPVRTMFPVTLIERESTR